MESETSKKQRFTKRRERAQVNQVPDYGSGDDDPPPRSFKDKPRSKPRKKKNNANLLEEDIIDGFAIISFKTYEDLENCIKTNTKKNEKTDTNLHKDKHKSSIKKKVKKYRPLPLPSPRLRQSEESVEPSSSGELTESHDKINSPRRSTDSRDLLSEGSSSSGRGYLCDSESGDERASDASSDIFSLNRNRESCLLPSSIPACSSVYSVTVTTPSTNSNITNTLASTTATSTSPTTTICALSTASVTVTTESTKTTCSITSPAVTTSTSVITNGPNVIAPSLKRKTLSPLSRGSPTAVKPVVVSKTTTVTTVPLSATSSPSVQKELRKVSPSPRVTPKREDFREKDHQSNNSFAKPFGGSGTPSHLFGPQVSLSPGLSPYHSSYPQQPNHNTGLPHSMFASPLPPGPSTNLGAGAAHNSPTDPMSIASQEILREELNRRFLAAQDRSTSSLIGPPPYMRADIHQHQHMHQHQHQHTHQHMYPIVPPFTGALVPTPAPLPVTKFGDSPFYRNLGMPPGYPGMSPLMPPTGGLSSTLTGAFQPKRVSTGLHPSQMLHSLRERDKIPSAATLPPQKKPGKWNAVHVRIAWEIYQHQQKHIELQKGQEGKTMEPLRPPSHLFPGGSLHRPTDLSASSMLLSQGSHSRSGGLEQSPGHSNFLNPIHSGASPFPKPSPYSMTNPLGFGGLGGSGSGAFSGREVPGIASPHEWNRLHRTPPSFPTAPNASWNKREEGEVPERGDRGPEPGVLALDRRREEDRERDRRNGEHERRINLDDRSRERELSFMKDAHASRSRSRSRSPLQNGRVGSAKSDSSYERRFDDKSGLKIKQERREEDLILQVERDKLRTDYLLGRNPAVNPLNFNMLDRARLLGAPSPYMLGDRVPPHPALFSPYDKNPMEMNLGQHRLQLQQDMERERERMLNRIQHPTLFDPEQLRKEELLFQDERARRDFLERLPFYDPQRLAVLEQSRYPHFRPPDPLSSHFPRTISPMIGHAKGGSPAGYPPPLIPSSSATQSRTQSPAVGRSKPSATDTTDKRDNYSNSTDPSVHNR